MYRAEAPKDYDCEPLAGARGDRQSIKVDLPWCGCVGMSAVKPVVSPRDQRGPVVEQVNPRAATLPPQLILQSATCKMCPERQPCDSGDYTVTARVGAPPEQDTSRYGQPNLYLQKVL